MGFDPGLEIGKILSNDEINKIFEGIQQGGIRPSTKNNCIVLISDPSGKIYQDKWIDETRIDYTGQGPEGNQKIAYGNKTLQNANVDNKKLFFFEIIGSGKYLYQGECDLVGEWYESKQKDIKHKLRRVYMFPLKLRHKRFHITLTEIEQEKYEEDDQKFKSEFAKEYTKRYFSNDEKPYPTGPKKRKNPVSRDGVKVYLRDPKVSNNALKHAKFHCEYDSSHKSFIRKTRDIRYMEPHHLVPMCFSKDFKNSLDVEQNIVSLCSECHNEIHYGKERFKLLEKLYNERKEELKVVGIDITFEQLKLMYK